MKAMKAFFSAGYQVLGSNKIKTLIFQLTRWFLPTAERRPQRKPVSPRWQNGWSRSSNEYPEPTTRERGELREQTFHVSHVAAPSYDAIFIRPRSRVCGYLECDSEDQHGEDERPKCPVTKHLRRQTTDADNEVLDQSNRRQGAQGATFRWRVSDARWVSGQPEEVRWSQLGFEWKHFSVAFQQVRE